MELPRVRQSDFPVDDITILLPDETEGISNRLIVTIAIQVEIIEWFFMDMITPYTYE